ncbi:MAG TPA: sigma-70 family RNA polymerase sigma factor [Epsilonproteobacteria bacterium]|nr:sigma-70 family RNA polymerase sigma factor [Campylobacterota bacterium]
MEQIWKLYAKATETINRLCNKHCYHLGTETIEECSDYIKRRIESNDFQALRQYDPDRGAKAETYLYMVVSKRIIDFFNSAKQKRELSSESSINNSYTEEEEGVESEVLDEMIGMLSDEEQTYLQYRYYDRLSYKEIGAIFGLTHRQAAKKVENIQIKLRKRFEKENYRFEDFI